MSRHIAHRPDTESELAYLKDFQRHSVEAVFHRMYLDANPTRRFLVADEVGLGKTLVARGVITKAIDHLWDKVKRIDVVYLCSNSDIARQNVRRLTPHGIGGFSLASRITLLPLETHNLNDQKVNVVALTPGTSLNLKGNLGLKRERALLLHVLLSHWSLDRTGASRLFAGNANLADFKSYVRNFDNYEEIDPSLCRSFVEALDADCTSAESRNEETIRQRLEKLVVQFRTEKRPSREAAGARTAIVGELRQILARSCIRALQPDLIVLDEFQRFKELLDGEGAAGEMAKHLFDYKDSSTETRVLLLSATPYKMYTVQDDQGNEDHYADFLRTARFLFADDTGGAEALGALLQRFRQELFRLGQEGIGELSTIKKAIEVSLRRVMIRTERLAVTADRSGMLCEKQPTDISLEARDISNYAAIQTLARMVDSPDTIEYWKAAPWLLNFMDKYKLRDDINRTIEVPRQSRAFVRAISSESLDLLRFHDAESFIRLDPAHGRLRWLIRHALDSGLWQLLWLPPALPYYELGTPFFEVARQSPTKSLLFSAWRVVPRVVAAIVSHEAERRMYVAQKGASADLHDATKASGPLKIQDKEQRTAGMTVLALMYPSTRLARLCDPIEIAATFSKAHGRLPTLEDVITAAELLIQADLARITPAKAERATPDESWYWAAPILIDRMLDDADMHWLDQDLAANWITGEHQRSTRNPALSEDDEQSERVTGQEEDDESSAIQDLVERVRQTGRGAAPGGIPPKDLLKTLALIGVAGPANVALRAFGRITGDSVFRSMTARNQAASVGASFRTLFNQPDSTAIVKASASGEQDYWKQCLMYSAMGCIQSVLDEYAHLLVGEAGVFGKSPDDIIVSVAEYMSNAVSLRRARVGAHNISVTKGKVSTESATFRSRFAMRFGEERADETGDKVRADEVRKAFNSPFSPFVLATTSVGQEGLDFHLYCHRVVHWNLPPNPVDLEQREGRVHRFKGHAVRKNVAARHSDVWRSVGSSDPWEEMFCAAQRERPPQDNDLVPFWVYTAPEGAMIERYVPSYGLSRDVERFKSLKESLVLYRMVFGQPRQEELLDYLTRVVPQEKIPELMETLRISLAPRPQ